MKKQRWGKRCITLLLIVYVLATILPVQAKTTTETTFVSNLDKIIENQKITKSTSNEVALKKLFTYVQKKYNYGRGKNFTGKKGWETTYAQEMLSKKKGSCYHYAALYAFLAKRATGLPVRICWGTSNAFNKKVWQNHAWVEIKLDGQWYTYDPNAARYSKLRVGKWFQQSSEEIKSIYKKKKYITLETNWTSLYASAQGNTPVIKKVKGKTYGYDSNGNKIQGIYVINEKFYVFGSKGLYNATKSKQLRKASKYEKNAKTLRKLLGTPQKTKKSSSCYGEGKDLTLYYPNFIVYLYRSPKGKEIVLGVESR